MKKKPKLTKAEAGRKGGEETVRRHGIAHMQKIGKAGFQAYARKLGFMGGSRLGAVQRLTRMGKFPGLTPEQRQQWDRTCEELMAELMPEDEGGGTP